jgi:uncharacterized protein
MSELVRSAFLSDLEVRGDGRTVVGIAVPFNEPTNIGRYVEVFRQGAFARTLTERGPSKIKLLALHDQRALPLGRLSAAREDAKGLWIEGRVSETQAGDEALTLVRDGALDSFSIGFNPMPNGDRWNQDRSLVERVEVRLQEVSLVPFPAYTGATVAGVRSVQSAHDDGYDPSRDPAHIRRRAALAELQRSILR